ncbi:MAG: 3-deoxy-D-manno-octulosonic acid transferase [Pseudomonadota bacterium]
MEKVNGIFIYNIFVFSLLLIGLPILLPLTFISEKRRKTVWHRLGFSKPWQKKELVPPPNPRLKPIWVHALSVGEALCAEPLLSGLKKKFPDHRLFFSVSTQTGYELALKQLKGLAEAVFYFPFDLPFSVKPAVRKIDPALVLIVETDIWPNFMSELQKRRIPVMLVNARLSERSFHGYKRLSLFFRPLFSVFTRICVQSDLDARRFAGIGIAPHRIHLTGNMKFDRERIALSPEILPILKKDLAISANQPVIVAGSTHNGEETILLKGMSRLKKLWPSLVMILAPRDPKRAISVSRVAESKGLAAITTISLKKTRPDGPIDVVVVDEMGMLRNLYALADISFVGGSLVPCSGHNPLEPAAWGKPILFGPDMRDFLTISRSLEAAGGAIRISDADSFCRATNRLLSAPDKAREMGQNALSVFQTSGGAVEKTLSVVAEYL